MNIYKIGKNAATIFILKTYLSHPSEVNVMNDTLIKLGALTYTNYVYEV